MAVPKKKRSKSKNKNRKNVLYFKKVKLYINNFSAQAKKIKSTSIIV